MNQTELFPSPPDDCDIGAVDVWARDLGLQPAIGVDEAGRGPLAGPVVAAAVVLPIDPLPPGLSLLNDSKKLTERTRDTLFDVIMETALAVGVGSADAATIDRINILEATRESMRTAVNAAAASLSVPAGCLLVDGHLALPGYSGAQWPLVKGDGRSWAIAAASVIAKVTRDREMKTWHQTYPVYGFDQHKGYGTISHRRALAEHGPCPVHRRSFKWAPPK